MSEIWWIHPTDEIRCRIDYGRLECPPLEKLQEYVGGLIEVIKVRVNKQICTMIVNEEGLIHNLPVNVLATAIRSAEDIYTKGLVPSQFIVGPAILLVGVELK